MRAQWSGDNLSSRVLGVQLHIENMAILKNMQFVSVGADQNLAGWRHLETELAAALRESRGTPNPYGVSLLSFGLLMCGIITYHLARDPAGVQHALNEMLRR